MIKLISLSVNGFKNLKINNLSFPPEGNILVMGKNESGKSTVFEAIFFALTSKLIVSKSRGYKDAIAFDKNLADIDLIIQKNGIPARIRKKISKRGTGSTVDISFWKNYGLPDEMRIDGGTNDIDPQIEEFLEFDDEILKNSCFVEQKGLDGFIEQDKNKRNKVINKLLNMDKITTLIDDYKVKAKSNNIFTKYLSNKKNIEDKQVEIEIVKKKIDDIDTTKNDYIEISKIKQELLELSKKLKELEIEREKIQNESHENQDILKTLDLKISKLESYKKSLEEIKSVKSSIKIEEEKLNSANNRLNQLEEERNRIKSDIENYKSQEIRKKESEEHLISITKEIEEVSIHKENLENKIKIDDEINRIKKKIEIYNKQYDGLEIKINDSKNSILNKIKDKILEYKTELDKQKKLKEDIDKDIVKQKVLENKNNIYKKIEELSLEIKHLKSAKELQEKDLNKYEEEIQNYANLQLQRDNVNNIINKKKKELEDLNQNYIEYEELKKNKIIFDQNTEIDKKVSEIHKEIESEKKQKSMMQEILNDTNKGKEINQEPGFLDKLNKYEGVLNKFKPIFIILVIAGIISTFFIPSLIIFSIFGGFLLTLNILIEKDKKNKNITNQNLLEKNEQYILSIEESNQKIQEREKLIEELLLQKNEKVNEWNDELIEKLEKINIEELSNEFNGIVNTKNQSTTDFMVINDRFETISNQIKIIDYDTILKKRNGVSLQFESINNQIEKIQNKIKDLRIEIGDAHEISYDKEIELLKNSITKNNTMIEVSFKKCKEFLSDLSINSTKLDNANRFAKIYEEVLLKILELIESISSLEEFISKILLIEKHSIIQIDLKEFQSKLIMRDKLNKELHIFENDLNTYSEKSKELSEKLPETYRNLKEIEYMINKKSSDRGKHEKSIKDLEEYFNQNDIKSKLNNLETNEKSIKNQKEEHLSINSKIDVKKSEIDALEKLIPKEFQNLENYEESMKKLIDKRDKLKLEINKTTTEIEKSEKDLKNNILKFKENNQISLKIKENEKLEEFSKFINEIYEETLSEIEDIKDTIKYSKEQFPDFKEFLDNQVSELNSKIGQCEESISNSKKENKIITSKKENLKIIDSMEYAPEKLTESFENSIKNQKIIETAIEILNDGQEEIMNKILPKTMEYLTKILPILTADRYKDVLITKDYKVKLFDSKLGNYVDKTLFSGGTNDQIALALRLSFAIATMQDNEHKESFIFLDEPLGFFDDERKNALIDFLTNGIISDKFAQRFVISNYLGIKPHFDFIIELDNGRIIEQYASGTLDSTQYDDDYNLVEEMEYVSLQKVESEEEDGYCEVEYNIKNICDMNFKKLEITCTNDNLQISPKYMYVLNSGDMKSLKMEYYNENMDHDDIFLNVILEINDKDNNAHQNNNKITLFKKQKICITPSIK